ncbi:MAG: hypothetical protein GWN79_20845, partial [Actinobacteria bacterium]|nr:hypothetical protein [Actinomycetota bacterium]NIS34734.1 hypothetical protein [Actinomycetota bacterium]NIT97724.1 hypothetical protein [Actinomycetota bacterium]NIU21364.1 hypothetical protein [Actinomycetota bacterium]NIU69490.1 hypothetical protein [Actinomycetota bacterium]
HPELVVLTGLRLGVETLAAEAALAGEVPFVAVLPYPQPDVKWPDAARRRFARLLDDADAVVRLERTVPATPQRAGQALDRRNGWLRQVADEALIVWDGRERRVGEQVRSFEQTLGEDVWVLDVG